MSADLHLHSRASDGSDRLEALIDHAIAAGLDCIALTDHDHTAHLDQAVLLGESRGIQVIPGVEISACAPISGTKVHILGYHLAANSPAVNRLCKPILEQRHRASLRAIAALRAGGFDIELEEVKSLAWGDLAADAVLDRSPVLYRQHVIATLIHKGLHDDTAKALISSLYSPTGPCARDMEYPDAVTAVQAIKQDGGMAVLAHPGINAVWSMVPSLVAVGLDGIEQQHPAHDIATQRRAAKTARFYKLFRTGGSDSHGAYGREPSPGVYRCPPGQEIYLRSIHGQELWFAENLVREAGAFLRRRRQSVTAKPTAALLSRHKDGDHRDLVSECDLAVDSLVRRQVQARWPGDQLLTEEGEVPELSDSSRVWILDPVDGTTNFLQSGRDYSVSLALWAGRKPCFGLVFDVANDELYRSAPGLGIWRNDERALAPSKPTEPASADPLNRLVLDASLNTITAFMRRRTDVDALSKRLLAHRSLGCASLIIVRIALGEIDAYVSDKLRVWDWAAAVIMLGETGGTWQGLFGHQLDIHDAGKHPFLAATAPGIASELVQALEGGRHCAPEAASSSHPQIFHTQALAELISG